MKINKNFINLSENFLFSTITQKTSAHIAQNPGKHVIRLGIGDISRPLAPAIIQAMTRAVSEMGDTATIRGYEAEQGYDFLKNTIGGYFKKKSVDLRYDEIFIGDGIGSDIANILDIFSIDNTVLIQNPVYPVYVDANIMTGRKIIYIIGDINNNFLPLPDRNVKADIIYLCSPNNPTGATYNKEQLQQWIDYALDNNAVILFDSAYEIFVQDKTLPTSIFQIDKARECAIEFCSLSKMAGFTGTRCGYTIIPHELIRDNMALNKLWKRRQVTKFNGTAYIVQRGAESVFAEEGWAQITEDIAYYMENAQIITQALTDLGIWYSGGKNAPYIWLKCPNGMSSWEFFDYLLAKGDVVGTPGIGFGINGEGFFRLSAFGNRDNVIMAMDRLKAIWVKIGKYN